MINKNNLELQEAVKKLIQSFTSHLDGRDLLEQLNPLHWYMCDIHVRINGKDEVYEGDWLKDVYYALRNLKEVLNDE